MLYLKHCTVWPIVHHLSGIDPVPHPVAEGLNPRNRGAGLNLLISKQINKKLFFNVNVKQVRTGLSL